MFDPMRKNKLTGRGYELLASRQAQLVPWHELAIEKCMCLPYPF